MRVPKITVMRTCLLVNNDVNLDALFGFALQDPIKPVFRIFGWGTS